MRKGRVAVVTYYGIDGACAAAILLLKFPDANVITSSQNRIGETLEALKEEKVTQVHICGVGVTDWPGVQQAGLELKKARTEIVWYCGRGYLDEHKSKLNAFCTPAFVSTGTNTACTAQWLGLSERCDAHLLMELALCDHNLTSVKPPKDFTKEQSDWVDFIKAATSYYLKYQDQETYVEVIRKLSRQELTRQDYVAIETFRRTGYQYVLHGSSPAMRELKRRIKKCAEANRHVIVTGESGVGKEHVAHLLWEGSPRTTGQLICVNCAMYAGNSGLANSDLFGHTKGAFTGATESRKGKFIEADTGILFLDELGELPLDVQGKFLRVIEDGWVTPEGADKPEKRVSVRIVSATNRDLSKAIRAGGFRADLYHRLSTLRLHVPPLRERVEDIDAIVKERIAVLEKEGCKPKLTRNDIKTLHGYSWPGNVRQLIKVLERAILLEMPIVEALEEEQALGEAAQYAEETGGSPDLLFPVDRKQVRPMQEVQKLYARNVWELHNRNYAATARALGVNPNTLRYRYLSEGQS